MVLMTFMGTTSAKDCMFSDSVALEEDMMACMADASTSRIEKAIHRSSSGIAPTCQLPQVPAALPWVLIEY
jgi:hypothetical protein